MIFLVSICFSFSDGFFGCLGDSLPVNALEAKDRLLQLDDEKVTIQQTFSQQKRLLCNKLR
jgi:hypothetical protein